jgi:hypothetical protein
MLHNSQELYGHKLAATDGEIGEVKDFYFDDQSWLIRYVVAETGTWLTDRQVLLSPRAFGRLDAAAKVLHVNLSRKRIEDSPSITTHRPVSRQHEEDYHNYYGFPFYWETQPAPEQCPPGTTAKHHGHNQRDDAHLRSTKALIGYKIEASDGAIGSVSGFMVDIRTWVIRNVVVETGRWYSGKEIHIAPGQIDRVCYDESKLFVKLTLADIKRTPENQTAAAK